MLSSRPQLWRLLLTLLVLVSTLSVSVAAVNPAHGHRGPSADNCAICQAGNLPLVAASASPQVQPYPVYAETIADLQIHFRKEDVVRSAPSRAPPAIPYLSSL